MKTKLEEMVDSFDKDLIGWKQHKRSFAIYFKRNVSKKYVFMVTEAWKMLGEKKNKKEKQNG